MELVIFPPCLKQGGISDFIAAGCWVNPSVHVLSGSGLIPFLVLISATKFVWPFCALLRAVWRVPHIAMMSKLLEWLGATGFRKVQHKG
jgi:hypothetical protein